MPIGGFVITCRPSDREALEEILAGFPPVEVRGADDRGNIVAVIETRTSDEMDDLIEEIGRIEEVLSVGLAYLHAEDEIERIATGGYRPRISLGKRRRAPEDA